MRREEEDEEAEGEREVRDECKELFERREEKADAFFALFIL
jgi:hypothetical protein